MAEPCAPFSSGLTRGSVYRIWGALTIANDPELSRALDVDDQEGGVVDIIAEVGPDGLRGPTKRWVPETLPWSSIASVANGWNVVVVTPVPGAGTKVVIPARATTSDIATIRAAIAHFSGGRL